MPASAPTPMRRRIYRFPDWANWLKASADKRAVDAEEFDLHLAAIEWSLASALDINAREDFRSIPGLAVSPFEHQVENAIQFFRRLSPRGLIADDVGLGKTITAGLIARELLDRGKIESILVVCPKTIIEQWREELETKFNIGAIGAAGSDFRDLGRHPFWITTYHTARNHIAAIKARNFDLVILDEAHAFRNLYGAQKPPKTALAFQQLMHEDRVRFCLMLTATPIQNRLWDIYSEFDILRAPQPNPLGAPDEFSRRFIVDRDARQLRAGTEQEFRRRVSQALIRTRRKDSNLLFPEREVRDSRLAPLPGEREYIDAALEVILRFPRLTQFVYARGLMSSPWAAAASFENKANDPSTDPALRRRLLELAAAGRAMRESAKTRAIVDFVKAAAADGRAGRIIVFTTRLETLRFLAEALERAGFGQQIAVMQGGQTMANRRAVLDFMAEPAVRPIFLSTDTGAVGLNLQAGNVVVNYDLPWNPMIIEQRIGRVQRLGQRARHVIVHNLVLKGTIEDHVVLRLMEKLNLFHQAIGEMEELLELCGYDEANRSLDQVIMDLVRKAAERKDISEDLERMERSRRAAEEKMKEIRAATEQALGSIRPPDNGVRLTGLRRVTPRMDLGTLIRACLRRSGVQLRETSDGRLFAKSPRGEVEILFDPADASAQEQSPDHERRVAVPGTKAFDRITQRVRDGALLHLLDAGVIGLEKVEANLTDRLQAMGMVLERLDVVDREAVPALWLGLKVSAAVATDRYETLLELPDAADGDGVGPFADPAILREMATEGRLPPLAPEQVKALSLSVDERRLAEMLSQDEAVDDFCTFYEARFAEDLERLAAFVQERHPSLRQGDPEASVRRAAERDPAVRTALGSLEFRLTPQVEVTPAGLSGVVYHRVQVDAYVRNRHQHEAFPIRAAAIPLTGAIISDLPVHGVTGAVGDGWACRGGHVVAAADFERCGHPDCTVGACRNCLEQERFSTVLVTCVDCERRYCNAHSFTCAACKSPLCAEHAFRLADSGAAACARCTTVLPDGRRLLSADVVPSAVSGRMGAVGDLIRSPISGRLAYPEEMVECEESGRLVLPDEVERCAVTGKRVARDLLGKSEVSGRFALRAKMVESEWTRRECVSGEEVICDETGAILLPDEVGVCSVTKRQARKDLLDADAVTGQPVLKRLLRQSAVSGRLALPENMVESEVSGRFGLPDEVAHCGVCSRRVLRDELLTCPETGRSATRDHFSECEATRVPVLPDGLGVCEVTGKRVRRSLLRVCPETGKTALDDLFETCDATGVQVLADALGESAVSGKRVRRSLLVACEESGALALPHELGVCAVTRRRVHPDLLVKCPDTGLAFLPESGIRCEETGALVHPSAAGQCSATGRRVRLSELVGDDLTGQPILRRLSAICEVSGVRTLATNLKTSAVSGKRVLADRLRVCEESGRPALAEELERCAESGRMVHPDLLFICPETGARILRRLGERCEATGELCSPAGLGTCEATGKRVRRSLLATDEITGATVQEKLLRTCERTGRRTLAANLARSQVSGALVLRDLLVPCEASGGLALPDELQRCGHSGRRVLPRLLARCEASGEMVLAELLRRCEVTGKRVLPSFLSRCRRTGKNALAQLFGYSEVSGEPGLAELLQRCAATDRRALPDELVTLSDGRRVGRDRAVECAGCGATADVADFFRCAICQQRLCKAEGGGRVCSFCRALLVDGKGQELRLRHLELLRNHFAWVRDASHVLGRGLIFVEGRGFSIFPGKKTVLAVFERRGEGLEEALCSAPLIHAPVRREVVRAMIAGG